HYIALIAVVLQTLLRAQIIKTKHPRIIPARQTPAVSMYHLIPLIDKLITHLPAGLHHVAFCGPTNISHQPHQGCLAASYRTKQQYALVQIDVEHRCSKLILQEVTEKCVDDNAVFLM